MGAPSWKWAKPNSTPSQIQAAGQDIRAGDAAFCVWRPTELRCAVKMSKRVFRAAAALLFLAALVSWLAAGANRGWTKTSVPVKRTDEVTGISVDDYQKRFVPGIDFLGAALLGSGILAGASLLIRSRQPQAFSSPE